MSERMVVELCRDLVRLRSDNPPGSERAIAEYCASFLDRQGLETRLISHSDTRASALACMRGRQGGQKPGLLICSHIDTVPIGAGEWLYDPFGGEIAEGKIWGHGASDMKGGLSAALAAVAVLRAEGATLEGDLWLAMTAGEEVDFLGARAVAELGEEILPLRAILLPEPSDNQLYIAQKGALWVEVTLTGKTAHGSMPQYGVNALCMAVEVIRRLGQLEFFASRTRCWVALPSLQQQSAAG